MTVASTGVEPSTHAPGDTGVVVVVVCGAVVVEVVEGGAVVVDVVVGAIVVDVGFGAAVVDVVANVVDEHGRRHFTAAAADVGV